MTFHTRSSQIIPTRVTKSMKTIDDCRLSNIRNTHNHNQQCWSLHKVLELLPNLMIQLYKEMKICIQQIQYENKYTVDSISAVMEETNSNFSPTLLSLCCAHSQKRMLHSLNQNDLSISVHQKRSQSVNHNRMPIT